MERVKLIACDLDGTLLLDGAQSLRPDTCGLIQSLLDGGILFFAASGRQYTNLQRLFWTVREKIGYLCENGCVSFYQGRQLHKEHMDRSLGRELIRTIILAYLGISPEECMAIGDNDNDREMLELVGCPVAVKSAKPEIRALARYETDTVEHLLWKIISGERKV